MMFTASRSVSVASERLSWWDSILRITSLVGLHAVTLLALSEPLAAHRVPFVSLPRMLALAAAEGSFVMPSRVHGFLKMRNARRGKAGL